MIISAIKYKIHNNPNPYSFRFSRSTTKCRNILCHFDNKENIDDFSSAIYFALQNKISSRISEVSLYLTDGAGDTWIIDKKDSNTKYLKNGKIIEGNVNETLLAALLDFDTLTNSFKIEEPTLYKTYEIIEESGNLAAYNQENIDRGDISFKKLIKDRIEDHTQACLETLDLLKSLDESTIISLSENLEPLYNKWLQVQNISTKLSTAKEGDPDGDISLIPKLCEEIHLITQIKSHADPLLNPQESPSIINDKLVQVEDRLEKYCERHKVTILPLSDQEIEWEKLLTILSKLKALETLLSATNKTNEELRGKVDQIFEDYLISLEEMLKCDQKITSELEKSLDYLTFKLREEQSPETEEQYDMLKGIKQIFLPKPQDNKPLLEYIETTNDLENSKMNIDYALNCLTELHTSLIDAKSIYSASLSDLDSNISKLRAEGMKLKEIWVAITEKYNIPKIKTIKALLNLIKDYGAIHSLCNERKQLRSKLAEYKKKIEKLKELITTWRKINQSQKNTALDRTSLLLTEARGIISYYEPKCNQLQRLIDSKEKISAKKAIKDKLEEELGEIEKDWSQIFTDRRIENIEIKAINWSHFFEEAKKIASLQVLLNESDKPLINNEIFSPEALDTPLTIYRWNMINITNKARLQFLKHMEEAPPTGLALLLTSDPTLNEMTIKGQFSHSIKAETVQKKVKKQVKKEPVKKPILSPKAQAALQILRCEDKSFR